MKIFDTITFFRENFITNLRFEILDDVVDFFVVCESNFDHKGNKKDLNFSLKNSKFKNKLIYLTMEKPFEKNSSGWQNQAEQREYIFNGLKKANDNDYVMFSDPDEIPDPKEIKSLSLKKKYGIFMQKCFCYKINMFNKYETPWEGTRVAKLKDLRSIDYLRQKIVSKNLKKPFWKFQNKDIQLIENGGWHFNTLLSPEEISIKLKTFAHSEYSGSEYSDVSIIKKNIDEQSDLFRRGWKYQKVKIDSSFPNYICNNQISLKEWII